MIYTTLLILGFLSFLLSFLLVLSFRKAAPTLKLIDESGREERKDHMGRPALVGGAAIVTAFLTISSIWFPPFQFETLIPLMWGMGLYVILGMVDDAINIPALIKLALQVFIALTVVIFFDFALYNLGNLGRGGVFSLGDLAGVFTLFCILTYINAFNMIDGIDGLGGGISFMTFLIMGMIAYSAQMIALQDALLILVMASFGFLILNMRSPLRRKALVFLGDGGSLSLSFAIAFCAVSLGNEYTANQNLPSPIIYAFILAYPIFDMITVMMKRFSKGLSIFVADTNHLHHILKKLKMPIGKVSVILIALSNFYAFVGIALWQANISQNICLAVWVALLAAHYIFCWGLNRKTEQST